MTRRLTLQLVLVFAVIAAGLSGVAAAGQTTVIVEMDGEPAALFKARHEQDGVTVDDDALEARRDAIAADQDAVLAAIAAAGIDFEPFVTEIPDHLGLIAGTIDHRWTLVYNGAAITLAEADVPALRQVPGVAGVHPARNLNPQLDRSVAFTRASELYGGVAELTQFDDLREGYEGQGIVISVIDTGIEWHHEMFGGDPTPPRLGVAPVSELVPTNEKVIYYLPFSDLAVEDGFGHGTHVASTAAGYLGFTWGGDGVPLTDDDVPVHGVAPQAKLMAYGVCSDVLSTPGSLLGVGVGGCLNVFTITALEDSVSPRTVNGFPKPVAHVINLSLGGNFGTPDDETAVAASNAAALGAIVVAAAGNAGDTAGIVGSPSTGRRVISVANATDPGSGAEWYVDALAPGQLDPHSTGATVPAAQLDGTGDPDLTEIKVFPMSGTPAPPEGSLAQHLVYVDAATSVDYPTSVAGRIALIENAAVAGVFAEYANGAALAGAEAALLIGTTENATAVTASIPVAVILPDDAASLIELFDGEPVNGDVSSLPIRVNPGPALFRAEVAGSSSRGPVAGFGQVKPDLSAPGTNVLAAVPPPSVIGAVTATEHGPAYGAISGTSMATPHVAGIAALVKQANPGWSADEVRTVLINNATPFRDAAGTPDTYGPHNPKIHSQGGGYVDANDAATSRAMMGVRGDGVLEPSILGSHSFGSVPVIGSRCVHEQTVEVELVDLRGNGGAYSLSVHANRNADLPGVVPTISATTVELPAGGSATFEAGLSVDGDLIRDGIVEVQWFLVADRTDGSETLVMPFFLRAVPSVPAGEGGGSVSIQTHTGSVGPGSTEAGVGEQSIDVPVEVAGGTFRLQGDLTADLPTAAAYPDFDLELYDPTGTQIDSSGNLGSIESVDVEVSQVGTYVFRVVNYLNVSADFTLTVGLHRREAGGPASVEPIEGEYGDVQGQAIDFDGAFDVRWHGGGGETAFELERSLDGGPWMSAGVFDPSTTSIALSDQPNGAHAFRVRAHFPGRICTYVELPGEAAAIVVDRREAIVLPDDGVRHSIGGVSTSGDTWAVDVRLTNDSGLELLAPIVFEVVDIEAGGASVIVINADNGGTGTAGDVAAFDYSATVGDERLSPGETSALRSVRVSNPEGQLFRIRTRVRAYTSAD